MKPDLNSGKPDLRLTAIRDPEQTTPASQLPLPENKTKKRKTENTEQRQPQKSSEDRSVMAVRMMKQPEAQNEHSHSTGEPPSQPPNRAEHGEKA